MHDEMLNQVDSSRKTLSENLDTFRSEISKTTKYIIMVDLANSTKFKIENNDRPEVWIKRQVYFLRSLDDLSLAFAQKNEIETHNFFKKFVGDMLFLSISTIPENIINLLEELTKLIKKINQNTEENYHFYISVDFGSVYTGLNQDPIGECVDRCSRISSIASTDQVLISSSAFEKLRGIDNYFDNLCVKFKQKVALKGIKENQCIYEFLYDNQSRKIATKDQVASLDVFKRKTKIIGNPSKLERYNLIRDNNFLNKKLKVAAFGPHVDDIELGCGATLAKLIDRYDISLYYYIFSGHSLSWDGEQINPKRINDAKKSFKFLLTGKTEELTEEEKNNTEFTIYKDGDQSTIIGKFKCYSFIDGQMDTRQEEIRKVFRHLQTSELSDIDMIFVPSFKDVHQDHKAVGNASLNIFRKQETLFFYSTPDSGKNPQVKFNPNIYFDVSENIVPNSIFSDVVPNIFCDYQQREISNYTDVKLMALNFFDSEINKPWFNNFSFMAKMVNFAHDAYLPIADEKNKFAEGFEAVIRC